MDLFIETLTGAAFELRVSPFETIMSVKAKIQRAEGIPVGQQHLIWQESELSDEACLHDYAIPGGSTLRLVLGMRGGPVNTRPVVAPSSPRTTSGHREGSVPPHQVTLLVLKDGDQINLFRVLDRGDGTVSPLAESLSAGSHSREACDEDDSDSDEGKEQRDLREKLRALHTRMDQLRISRGHRGGRLAPLLAPPSALPSANQSAGRRSREVGGCSSKPSVSSSSTTTVTQHTSGGGGSMNLHRGLPTAGVTTTLTSASKLFGGHHFQAYPSSSSSSSSIHHHLYHQSSIQSQHTESSSVFAYAQMSSGSGLHSLTNSSGTRPSLTNGGAGRLLPPVLPAMGLKKRVLAPLGEGSPQKSTRRCAQCNAKTGLATSFQCRCGNNYCARHRYAELHECPFDYKAEARRVIREANPIVNAPKLPKI